MFEKVLRNDMNVGTLYLAHGVVTISFHCHPRELVKLTNKDKSMLIFMISMFLLFLKQQISVHQLILPVYTTRFGGLAWLVQLIQLHVMLLILISCILMGHKRPLIRINVVIMLCSCEKQYLKDMNSYCIYWENQQDK